MFDLPIYYKDKNNQNDYYIKVNDLKKELIKKEYPIRTSKLFFYIDNDYVNEYAYINNDKEIIDSLKLSPDNKIKLKLKNYTDKKFIKDTFFHLKNHFSELSENKNNSEKVRTQTNKNRKKNMKMKKTLNLIKEQEKLEK